MILLPWGTFGKGFEGWVGVLRKKHMKVGVPGRGGRMRTYEGLCKNPGASQGQVAGQDHGEAAGETAEKEARE